jgi:hypothetical protein
MARNEKQDLGTMVVNRHPHSQDILMIGCTLETANTFRRTAGAPYIWWSPPDNQWQISAPMIHNAIRLAGKIGITIVDMRSVPAAGSSGGPGRGPWCGQCDEETRHLPAIGGAVVRCPRCHPNAGQPTTTQAPEVPPSTEIWRAGLAKVRAELARVRNPPTDWTPDEDPDLPF